MSFTVTEAKNELEKDLKRHRERLVRLANSTISDLGGLKRRIENGSPLPDGVALSDAARLENTYQRAVGIQDSLALVNEAVKALESVEEKYA